VTELTIPEAIIAQAITGAIMISHLEVTDQGAPEKRCNKPLIGHTKKNPGQISIGRDFFKHHYP